jgi:hypothetical protein
MGGGEDGVRRAKDNNLVLTNVSVVGRFCWAKKCELPHGVDGVAWEHVWSRQALAHAHHRESSGRPLPFALCSLLGTTLNTTPPPPHGPLTWTMFRSESFDADPLFWASANSACSR